MESEHTYMAIDLKSFYASVECVAHHLDPLNANLVVADASRTDKTICLAVSPALKKFGVPGRPRLFEVEQKVAAINRERAKHASFHHLWQTVEVTESARRIQSRGAADELLHGEKRPNL